MKVLQVLLLLENVHSNYEVYQNSGKSIKALFSSPTQKFKMSWTMVKCWGPIEIESDKEVDDILFWEFSFGNIDSITGQLNYKPTGNGEQQYVLNNCYDFCKSFKKYHNPDKVGCTFVHQSQFKLYSRLLNRIWPEFVFKQYINSDNDNYIIGSKR